MKGKPEELRLRPVEVSPRPGESVDHLIKRFTKKVRNDGVLNEYRERRSYMKPSVKRRAKARKSLARSR